ncbi:hypothetical protein MTR_4g478250 [Medicago truncatula]|uniref:Uncharacterized protein n=1 Tax=Medicago truncatula TaxID=3880 RepID=A0A072ULM6_MEDTR|nr:hypothetical protein MTR_4g478250 [Medicago truncatula]
MYEVAKIEGRVRYSSFKKRIKVMMTPTDSLDDLKTQQLTADRILKSAAVYCQSYFDS